MTSLLSMSVYRHVGIIGAIIFLLVSTGINAAEPKIPSWYTAIETGDVSPENNDFEATEVASVYLGHQGEKYLFELGYVDLGEYEYLERIDEDDEVKGLQISLGQHFRVKDPISLYFELGFLIEGGGANPFSIFGLGEKGYIDSSFMFGLGAMFDIGETLGGRASFRRYNDTSAEKVDTLTLGLYLRF